MDWTNNLIQLFHIQNKTFLSLVHSMCKFVNNLFSSPHFMSEELCSKNWIKFHLIQFPQGDWLWSFAETLQSTQVVMPDQLAGPVQWPFFWAQTLHLLLTEVSPHFKLSRSQKLLKDGLFASRLPTLTRHYLLFSSFLFPYHLHKINGDVKPLSSNVIQFYVPHLFAVIRNECQNFCYALSIWCKPRPELA